MVESNDTTGIEDSAIAISQALYHLAGEGIGR